IVSGLVTSPCDHDRILSGDASEMRIASKSVVREPRLSKDGLILSLFVPSSIISSVQGGSRTAPAGERLRFGEYRHAFVGDWRLRLNQLFLRLHQLDVEAQRLELA